MTVMNIKEIFNFQPLTNNSVFFITDIISNHIIKHYQYFSFFLCYLGSYGSLSYKLILSVSFWWPIRLSSAFVFLDSEVPTISILYRSKKKWSQRKLHFCVFSPVTSLKLITIFIFLFFGCLIIPIFFLSSIYSKGNLVKLFREYLLLLNPEPFLRP